MWFYLWIIDKDSPQLREREEVRAVFLDVGAIQIICENLGGGGPSITYKSELVFPKTFVAPTLLSPKDCIQINLGHNK